ncbi:MAG TPA: GWxTD domain-containing protein [Candidatus Latescibacteria bacterium]|nr:GWxTD domain-containing protein [Candidatus Latescibacterota bacterium]
MKPISDKNLPVAGVFRALGPALLLLGLAAVSACRLYNIERKLTPTHSEFLSKVGFIITREERKIFLELPDDGKDAFIEEFWKRRDPDPDTERNEYRVEYEDRLEKAGVLFRGEGRPGWQTDRGRIYILFGPPQERLTYPMDAAGNCREVWYYGSFPVIFMDDHCSGNFVMTAINLEHLQALNIAQGYFQKTFTQEKKFFDYEVGILKIRAEQGVYEGKVAIDIPYATIWFTFKEERLETAFIVKAEMSDESGRTIWQAQDSFPLTLDERELKENRGRRFRMEFPLLLDKDVDRLKSQKVRLEVSVKNTTEGEELRKTLEFRLKF